MLWPYDIYLALKFHWNFEQFCSGQSRMQLFASSIIHLYFLIVLWFRKNPSIIFFDAGKQKKVAHPRPVFRRKHTKRSKESNWHWVQLNINTSVFHYHNEIKEATKGSCSLPNSISSHSIVTWHSFCGTLKNDY